MENHRKKIAIFGSNLTSRYKRSLCRVFTLAAQEFDLDLDQFDGIVFDGEGYSVDGMSESIERKLRTLKCPVVSISSRIK